MARGGRLTDAPAAQGGLRRVGTTAFRILFGVDVLAASVVVFFFFWGLADGTVSVFNLGMWWVLLLGVAGVLIGGYALRAKGLTGLASLVLLVLAVPAGGLFLIGLLFAILQPNMH